MKRAELGMQSEIHADESGILVVLLVGVGYDKASSKHECLIEEEI